jgi:hypothetical protein
MKTKIRRLIFLSFILLSITSKKSDGQQDFQSWNEIDLNFDLLPKTEFYVSNELRLDNNSSEINKYLLELGVEKKLKKKFSIAGGYRYTRFYDKGYYKNENRGIVVFKYSPRIQRFVIELQTRMDYIAEMNDGYIKKDQLEWRNKITLNYKCRSFPLTPYASFEHFTLTYPSFYADKYRLFGGAKYQITKVCDISAYFGLQNSFTKINHIYIGGLKFSYDFISGKKKN